jgi:hypothetical protein
VYPFPDAAVVGDGHPVESLPDVWGADARSAQIRRPDGKPHSLQVSEYSVEPRPSVRARNLLSKDDWRAALSDEPEPLGPEVTSVIDALAPSRLRERLARAAPGPNGSVIWPSGKPERVRPGADAGESVELDCTRDVFGREIDDAARVDCSGGDVSGSFEVSQPVDGIRFILVVERGQRPMPLVALYLCSSATRM